VKNISVLGLSIVGTDGGALALGVWESGSLGVWDSNRRGSGPPYLGAVQHVGAWSRARKSGAKKPIGVATFITDHEGLVCSFFSIF
jgi:hypothetical protein